MTAESQKSKALPPPTMGVVSFSSLGGNVMGARQGCERDLQVRDRDETETFNIASETRPRRDVHQNFTRPRRSIFCSR